MFPDAIAKLTPAEISEIVQTKNVAMPVRIVRQVIPVPIQCVVQQQPVANPAVMMNAVARAKGSDASKVCDDVTCGV
jgi:hypothetical protein